VRNPPRIMHQAESANPKNTRNFYRVFDESGYMTFVYSGTYSSYAKRATTDAVVEDLLRSLHRRAWPTAAQT
jgi:hypothetical protein